MVPVRRLHLDLPRRNLILGETVKSAPGKMQCRNRSAAGDKSPQEARSRPSNCGTWVNLFVLVVCQS
jgi:hypothetical protein